MSSACFFRITKVSNAENHRVYAHWNANTYPVIFNANGGSTSTNKKTVTYAKTYGTLPAPTRTGYTFKGWYTAASGGTKVTSSSTVSITAKQTLYAQWSANTYTITFNANGGITSSSSKSVTYNGTYGDLPTPTKDGYSFLGWYTAASGGTQITSSSSVSTTANQTLYAQWIASQIILDMYQNGADVGDFTADGSTELLGFYYLYAWKNTTGRTVNVTYTLNNREWISGDGIYSATLYYDTTMEYSTSTPTGQQITASWNTVSGTFAIPNGYYLTLFNRNNGCSKITLTISGIN